jgi:hypothetical protein
MTTDRDIQRILDRWLADGPFEASDRVLDTVTDRIERLGQRPAWRLDRRPITMTILKLGGIAAAVAVLVLAGITFLGGYSSPFAGPSPTPTATPGPAPLPMTTLNGGRYLFRPLGGPALKIVATGPAGWGGFPDWAIYGPGPVGADAPTGIAISFLTPTGLYSDPCHWDVAGNGLEGQHGDVTVGPTVDDLVAALRANTFYTSSNPTPVTVGGYAGQELELQFPNASFTTCDKATGDADGHAFPFSDGVGLHVQGPANRWHLFIIDAQGTRLVAAILSYPGTARADLDVAQGVIDTLSVTP